ncbi:MAG: hypothetical protein COC11_04165 [Candidatus Neomarinimicrobiota bacterium]|nr:MAG: hypothetical protein COC11_04165 [Candidatus Neomarinimicrobiota bacterium]
MININELRQRLAFTDKEGNYIDDADVMANPKKYGLPKFKRTKPSNWKPKPDPEHEAFVKKQYEDFDETMGIIKVQKEDLEKDRESYESSVIRKPRKHRPKKPTQQDRVDVMEARLRQRLARIYES